MINEDMYKVNFQSGQNKLEVISLLQKEGESWVLCKDADVEKIITDKLFSKGHHNKSNNSIGYGQIVLTDKFAFVTGDFEIPKK